MTGLLFLTTDRQRDRDDLADELIANYQLACELRAQLDTTPRWRRRRRSNIDRGLRHVCRDADLLRDALGAANRDGMYELLERTAAREAGR